MISFRDFFLTESVQVLDSNLKEKILSIFSSMELKSSNSKSETYILRSSSREEDKDKLMNLLKDNNINFTEEQKSSSVKALVIQKNNKNIILLFKPSIGSGGLSETTLNSTITELIPVILFKYPNLHDSDNEKTLTNILSNFDSIDVFVNDQDKKNAKKFLESARNSSKFESKMKDSSGVLKYLYILKNTHGLREMYWTYRSKPSGVPKDSKADIVLKGSDGRWFGVSLKSGGHKDKEPHLNTSVIQIKNFFESSLDNLYDILFKEIYLDIGVNEYDFRKKTKKFFEVISEYEKNNKEEYEKKYNLALKIIKDNIVKDFTNLELFKKFTKEKILKEYDIPIITLKVVNGVAKEMKDDEHISGILELVKDIKVSENDTNKQNLFVTLNKPGENDPVMLFSIRSSQPQPKNKLGQVPNLKVTYNGIK